MAKCRLSKLRISQFGDIVIIETGDYIPADLRLCEAVNLKIQESALTGESVPIQKDTDIIEDEKTSLGDRKNMAFSSSMVTYGRGKGIVTSIRNEYRSWKNCEYDK